MYTAFDILYVTSLNIHLRSQYLCIFEYSKGKVFILIIKNVKRYIGFDVLYVTCLNIHLRLQNCISAYLEGKNSLNFQH